MDWFMKRSLQNGDRIAVQDGESGQGWTYAEMDVRASRIALFLRQQGVSLGDRVGLFAPNDVAYVDLLFACRKIGAIFVPFNWRLSVAELNGIITDCTPTCIFVHPALEETVSLLSLHGGTRVGLQDEAYQLALAEGESLADPVECHMSHAWMMIYTGGTTGKPKGVILSYESVLWNAVNTVISWNLTADEITPTYLPMFHTGGLNALSLPVLIAGGTVVIAKSFDAESVVKLLNQERCTIALMVPTMYHMLINSEAFEQSSFPTMHTFISGGAPCPQAVYEAFAHKKIAFKEGYGATESGPNNFVIDPKDSLRKSGSVGRPMMFTEVKLMRGLVEITEPHEVGEVVLYGKHLFQQYWKQPEATQEVLKNGWFYTGDLGKRDEEGFYYIVGRKKDMIITGGENVYPQEVEKLIESHPYVREAAVIGVPDTKWGEVIAAVVVLQPLGELTAEELKAYCSCRIAKYKIPKRFRFISELPKTAVGKCDKKALVALFLPQ
ncbi:long-chain fatty acid--CoA ligase [Paenibacillus selenitireducens]|uniref:Long-chain fatty acid--CoA ligase n=2 Tax=Paenibacillus selenitireducens TaxID=1324314 RepID=A0A1T2XLS4_9BACL|nr:long-chain fatty acid--CoA ligase [Paenibacillus selenitireducens]